MTQVATENTSIEFPERRGDRRRRVLKGGSMFFNGGYGAFGCRVRNLSDNGAMLEMSETTGLPSEFDFRVSNERGLKVAKIIWRERSRLGIHFG